MYEAIALITNEIPAQPKLSPPEPEQRKGGFFRDLLRAPKFGNPAKDRIAGLQQNILMGLLFTSLLGIGISLAFWSNSSLSGLGMLVFMIFLSALAFYW